MFKPPYAQLLRIVVLCTPVYLAACAGYESNGTLLNGEEASPTPEPATGGSTTTTTPPGTTSDTNVTGEYELTVKGATPTAMVGKKVYAALLDANNLVIGNANTTADASGFTLSFPGKVNRDNSYSVAYYIDASGNGFCNISDPNDPNTDRGYVVNANVTSATTTVTADANAMGTTYVCNRFGNYGFSITGADYSPHNGEYLFVALMDKADGSYVAGPADQQILNGTWRFSFPSVMLPGHTYEALYWVDQNHSDVCENHSWIYDMSSAPTGDFSTTVSHDLPQSPVCATFPKTLPKD